MNLPNSITLARIGCVPLFLWILSSAGLHVLHASHGQQALLAAAVLLLASFAGAVDGFLARRMQRVTTLGGLLSALADQLLLATAYIALVRYAPELLPAWLAVLMVGREFMVTGLCAVAAQERMTLGVRDIGKAKTALQTISVVAVLLAHAWPRWQLGGSGTTWPRCGNCRGHSVADAGGVTGSPRSPTSAPSGRRRSNRANGSALPCRLRASGIRREEHKDCALMQVGNACRCRIADAGVIAT